MNIGTILLSALALGYLVLALYGKVKSFRQRYLEEEDE